MTKELLSELLNVNIDQMDIDKDEINYSMTWKYSDTISVYKVSHLLKKHILKKFRTVLWTCLDSGEDYNCRINSLAKEEFYAKTELEAIYKAYVWLLRTQTYPQTD